MLNVFGKEYSSNELRKRIGDITQIAGAIDFVFNDGKAKGTRAIDVKNGSGLRFTVLPDKGMNISYAEINGIPFSYISKTGVVSPVHYDEPDFLRSFEGGLLTTCGLTYMGAPCLDEGVSLGAHGRISNTPAFDVCVEQGFNENDEFVVCVSGKVKEACMFGDNLVLKRKIFVKMGDNTIYISDEIVNEGFNASPLMVLYHMNFGYPLIDENTVLNTNCVGLRARDDDAKEGLEQCEEFSKPIHGYREQVFYRDSVKNSFAELSNKDLGLSVKVEFTNSELPYFVEWKQMGEQEYVVGMEPATYPPDGREKARKRGELDFIEPGEKKNVNLQIKVNCIK